MPKRDRNQRRWIHGDSIRLTLKKDSECFEDFGSTQCGEIRGVTDTLFGTRQCMKQRPTGRMRKLILRVFNINKAIGYASSGVEYAQKYRHQMLKNIPDVDDFYVFTDYISTNLCVFSDLMDFPRESVIWIYNYLADRPTKPCTITIEDFISTLKQKFRREEAAEKYTDVLLLDAPVRYRIWTIEKRYIDRVDTIVYNQLEQVDHYDDSLNNVEYYQGNQLIRRVFLDSSGEPAFQQFYQNREITQTIIQDEIILGRSRFFQYFFKRLFSKPDDVVIVDRALDVIDSIYPVIVNHRLFSVVHAEHYDLNLANDRVLLWNNHYEFVFSQAKSFSGIIVSTERQKQKLQSQLPDYNHIMTIPVGVVEEISQVADYEAFSLMTASRLASEKHIDLLIKAVILARRNVPNLHLDIYGEGNRSELEKLIKDSQAGEFVSLKGHKNLQDIYPKYGIYVTASTSEGFGLSLMEAIANGLPVVGFKVEYGNTEMVEDGVNGYLYTFEKNAKDSENLAAGITEILSSGRLEEMRAASRAKAQKYLCKNVQKKWEEILTGGDDARNI